MFVLRRVLQAFLVLLFLVAAGGYFIWYQLNPSPPDQQVFLNSTVLTMDQENSTAEAVLVEQGIIIAVGSEEAVLSQASLEAEHIDLAGKTLLPGFIEAHGHFPGSGLSAVAADLNSPPIGSTLSIKDALNELKVMGDATPEGEWIIGFGFDDTMILEKRFLSKEDLDQVSTEHPVAVLHISGHMVMINTLGLEIMGITRDSKDPTGGEIVRDSKGNVTGLLKEKAQDPVVAAALNLSLVRIAEMLQKSQQEYLEKGVTTVQSGLTNIDKWKPLAFAARFGFFPQRLVIWPDISMADSILDGTVETTNSEKLTVGALKLVSDGSIQGYTGFLKEPYHQQEPDRDTDYRGYPTMTREKLQDIVTRWHASGRQLAIHANGDAAIDLVIDSVAEAQQQSFRSDPRHIIVHAQMMTDGQLKKSGALGLTPSFFPSHIYYWGDRHFNIFMGAKRAEHISPMRSAEELDVRFTMHNDTPVVPIDPMLLVENAVERKTSSGKELGGSQKISVESALRALTIDAAWQVFQEGNRGSIEPGKFADFAILEENPLTAPGNLQNIKVAQTWIGGVKWFDRDQL